MSLHLNGNTIGDLYVGGTKVGEAWFNGQKVYSSAPPVINYIFRDIDANGNLTIATGALEDASKITVIANYGLSYAFYRCEGLTGSISFQSLTSITCLSFILENSFRNFFNPARRIASSFKASFIKYLLPFFSTKPLLI